MVYNSAMRLGRKAIKTDTRTLKFARYLTDELQPAPPSRDWTQGVTEFGMMQNDILGDCTIAACGHALQIWTMNASKEVTLSDIAIRAGYEEWCGYNPKDPLTDAGGVELDVLTDWRKHSFHGHHLVGFTTVNYKSLAEIQVAIELFGGVYIGLALPISAQEQNVWSVVPDDGTGNTQAGSWGGHAVYVPKYQNGSTLTCITWGQLLPMTEEFWHTYVDESYCLFGRDWINSKGTSPSGFNLTQLQADLGLIR